MTDVQPSALRAATAICAVLALAPTPAWSQDSAPAIDLPVASAPAARQSIVLPSAPAAEPAMVSQPIVQPAPVAPVVEQPAEEPVAEAPVRVVPRQRPAARAPVATAPEPIPEPVAQVAPVTAPLAAALAVPAPLAPPVADPGAQETAEPGLSDGEAAVGAAALAVLLLGGIGGGAWLVARSRRRAPMRGEAHQARLAPAQEPVRASASQAALDPAVPLPAFATFDGTDERSEHAKALARGDGPLPRTRAERDTLLHRMASAAPSAENPFTSRKARLRRARLILQRREYEERERTAQPFDWRTYEPPARQPAPATPRRVTA